MILRIELFIQALEDWIWKKIYQYLVRVKVYKVQGAGLLLDGNRSFSLSHLLRPATFAEVFAKRRMTLEEQALAEVS